MAKKETLRELTFKKEQEQNKRILCHISSYPCVYCPLCVSGVCPHLKRYLKTGKWKKD